METISPIIVEGDLLNQPVEVIVNTWNRNIIPWWLLWPRGVSRAIKKRAGYKPFFDLGKVGPIPLGGAVLTTAGKLNYRGIIHVAGINMLWRSTKYSIKQSVVSAMGIVNKQQFESVAFPIIGAGTGGFGEERALLLMQETIQKIESSAKVLFVKFRKI
jgi:O-acetyl-ADP-ribose deacetylase (regulator of RNase III)